MNFNSTEDIRDTYEAPGKKTNRSITATRRGAVLTVLATAAAVITSAIFFPQIRAVAQMLIPPCAMLFIGLHCPLCGGTRCVSALSRLDLAEAFYYNPLVVVCGAVCVYLFLRVVISCFSRPYKQYRPRTFRGELWVLLAIYLAYFVIRNLPFYRAVFY